jgi:hypothetical protein
MAGTWRVYVRNRMGKVADYKTPCRVNLAPGEEYRFFTAIENKADLLLLDQLANVVPLAFLYISDKNFSFGDECLSAVSSFSYLKELTIDSAPSFQGIACLKGMTSLKRIVINSVTTNRVTDEAIMQLSGLVNLEELELLNSSVTADGEKRFRQMLPRCKVERKTFTPSR